MSSSVVDVNESDNDSESLSPSRSSDNFSDAYVIDMSPKFVHDKSLSKGKGGMQRRGAIVELEEKSAKADDSERVLTSVPSSIGVDAGAAKKSAGSNVFILNSSDRISSESVSPNRVIQRRGSERRWSH